MVRGVPKSFNVMGGHERSWTVIGHHKTKFNLQSHEQYCKFVHQNQEKKRKILLFYYLSFEAPFKKKILFLFLAWLFPLNHISYFQLVQKPISGFSNLI